MLRPPPLRRLSVPGVCIVLAVAAGCGGGSGPGPAGPTAGPGRGPGPTAEIVAVGDIGWCGSVGTQATAELVDSLAGWLLLAGDIAYPNGAPQDYQRCFDPAWGRFRSRWHPSPGNHDFTTPNGSAYFDYFGEAAGSDRSGYYALSLGDWQVLMLNSNIPAGRGSTQWEFVRRELELQRRPCTMAVWHHPVFTSGQNGPNLFMREMFALLEVEGADVVVNGHDHLYERFARQSADGRPVARGIRQFTVGTGGADLYRFVTTAANSEVRIAQFGALRMSLQPSAYRWEFVLTTGGLADSGNESCQ